MCCRPADAAAAALDAARLLCAKSLFSYVSECSEGKRGLEEPRGYVYKARARPEKTSLLYVAGLLIRCFFMSGAEANCVSRVSRRPNISFEL